MYSMCVAATEAIYNHLCKMKLYKAFQQVLWISSWFAYTTHATDIMTFVTGKS